MSSRFFIKQKLGITYREAAQITDRLENNKIVEYPSEKNNLTTAEINMDKLKEELKKYEEL